MSSSTGRSDIASTVAVLAVAVASVLAAHVGFEAAARWAELRLGAYLWKNQDQLRALAAHLHVDRGHDRLSIFGPSEAREGLLPDVIGPALPGIRAYQNAQSMGTFDDALLMLDYIARAHGPTAVPRRLLLGVTPRFVANLRTTPSPVVDSVRTYSPFFDVDAAQNPPSLVPRPFGRGLVARWRLLGLQPDRYRRGLVALALAAAHPFAPDIATRYSRRWLRPSNDFRGRWASDEATERWLLADDGFWRLVHAWDPADDRARVTDEFHRLIDYANRYGVRVYVVNLPELSMVRARYRPGRYDAYLATVREAIGETPFLDLRTFLRDDEIWDDAHPTLDGAVRLSTEVAAFIRQHDGKADAAREPQ
jgi:hypothetical protein